MSQNASVKFIADVADFRTQMVAAQSVMKETAKVANDAAKAVAAGDMSAAAKSKLLEATQAAVGARYAFRDLGKQERELVGDTKANASAAEQFIASLKTQAATAGMSHQQMLAYRATQLGVADEAKPLIAALEGQTKGFVSSRAATEGLVLVHEAMRGNYTRMTGSAMIMTQALIGHETVAKAVTAVLSPMGAAVIAAGAAMAYTTYQGVKYEMAQDQLRATMIGLGAASGLSAMQVRAAGIAAADASGMSVSASTAIAQSFATTGVRSQAVIAGMTGAVKAYAQLTGQDMTAAEKALADAMRKPEEGAQALNEQLGILDATQMRQIHTMVEAGDKTGAVNVVMQALKQRFDDANQSGVTFGGTLSSLVTDLENYFTWVSRISSVGNAQEILKAAHPAPGPTPQQRAQWGQDSAAGGKIVDATPEGQEAAQRDKLTGSLAQLKAALAADTALHGANSAAVQSDKQAIIEYTRAVSTYLPEAQKAHQIAVLDAQLAEARQGRDKGRIADLTRQRELLQTAGQVMSPDQANQRANDAASLASDRGPASKKAKDDTVAKWTEQLRAQEIASQNYFGDQTAMELAFWQARVGLVAQGSHDWLEVQAHIFEASKALAHQAYQDQIATLNEKLAADHNSWSKEQADYQAKLSYIKSVHDEQSAEYKNALREMETAQREHEDKAFASSQEAMTRQMAELKKDLDQQAKIRDDQARLAETAAKGNSSSSPFGDISAEQQVAQIHAQLIEQKIADNELFHANENLSLELAMAKAKAAYSEDSDQYRKALEQKTAADQQYANTKQTLEAEQQLQALQDIESLKAKYHSYIDGTVSTTVSGFDKMITGQKTFGQVGISIYQSLVRTGEQQVERLASEWLVKHLFMTAAQRTQLAVQTSQQALSEGAKTAAVVAGTTARVATTAQGAAATAAIASLTNKKSITSDAAAAAASAYKAMAGIPVIGPVLGAAAATVTFAAVEAYGALASFDKGANILPNDMVAQIHAGERIVPKGDNDRLIALTERGAGLSDGRSGGDTHFHYNPTVNGQIPFADQLAEHEGNLISMVQNAHRRGSLRLR